MKKFALAVCLSVATIALAGCGQSSQKTATSSLSSAISRLNLQQALVTFRHLIPLTLHQNKTHHGVNQVLNVAKGMKVVDLRGGSFSQPSSTKNSKDLSGQ